MSFTIVVSAEAQNDLDEIFIWYEEQQRGLGVEFIIGVDQILEKILRNPLYASIKELDARSASLKRFPYDII